MTDTAEFINGLSEDEIKVFAKQLVVGHQDQVEFAETLANIRYLAISMSQERDSLKKQLWFAAILEECDVNIDYWIEKAAVDMLKVLNDSGQLPASSPPDA